MVKISTYRGCKGIEVWKIEKGKGGLSREMVFSKREIEEIINSVISMTHNGVKVKI